MKYFIKSVLAGILIVIAVTVYLMSSDKVVGAFLFSLALIIILTFKYNLYTGKVGYILDKEVKYIWKVLLVLLGNFIGVIGSSYLIMQTRIYEEFETKVTIMALTKVSDSFISVLILSVFCGLLMYIAVDNFKYGKEERSKYIVVILCVMVFVMACFEHSIANIAYLNFSKVLFTIDGLLFILVSIFGNAIGAMIIPLYKKIK